MRRLMLLALPLALAACGSDNNSSTTPTLATLAGTWNLTTVNGAALPFTVSNAGGVKAEILSSVVTVSANGAFTQVTQIRTTIGTSVTTTTSPASGTISLSGNLLTTNVTGSGTLTGTLSNNNNTISLTDTTSGTVYVFSKQ